MLRHLAIALALSLVSAAPALALDPPEARAPIASFELDTLDGDAVSVDDYAGKVVVISFWATWCEPCLQELPFMQAFYEEHGPDDLVVLAISTDGPDSVAAARNIVRRNRWTMPILHDADGTVMAQLNPRGVQPFTIFVDREGRVAHTHEGYAAGDEVEHEATVDALLAE